ncbi:multicopper oxidase family protein [Actinoalloteichus sp. GBA129-24]|uniref:multicopper oxidase family protein n=1 Tax=Actinoalloteichus sp. GBA129-24 TaxID=1612551 RepID=UPI0009503CC1|nr:multicopper oxidase domain-containing protein [Actinoalloteichus sp. GBA129-24]APU22567.1 putative multicopper oxidase [Actinoalloteichus sp. GBA129-24]
MPSRRAFLTTGGAAVAALVLPTALGGCSGNGLFVRGGNNSSENSAGTLLRSEAPLPEPFQVPLPILPVLEPVRGEDGTDHYEIVQRAERMEILPGLSTEIWGYNGLFPGPTIVSRRGRRTVVTHRNELTVPVVVHLHGGRTAPEHDGYPTDLILPMGGDHSAHQQHAGASVVGSRDYVYELDQPAATLWYHDHRMDFTGPQVYRGLAGFHLIRDDEEEALPLPRGEREVPLMIADRSFASDGAFQYPSVDPSLNGTPGVTAEYMSGVLGDCILVNGAPWPVLAVSDTRYRFRILNASNARRYRLRLEGGGPFVQIGSDLGLLAEPTAHEAIDIAQAERFDVIIDFSGHDVGDEITMVNDHGRDGTDLVMRFVVTRRESDDSAIPDQLVELERLSEEDVVAERQFVFARGGAEAHGMTLWTVNGEPFSTDAIAARPRLSTVERWTIRALNVEHPFHIHLAPFQVLNTGGKDDAGPYNQGWKDTVNLDNGGQAELLIRFDGYRGRYVLHCHNLEHEDMMMMANFEVV